MTVLFITTATMALVISLILFTLKPRIWPAMDVQISEIGAVNSTSAKLWFRSNKFERVVRCYAEPFLRVPTLS